MTSMYRILTTFVISLLLPVVIAVPSFAQDFPTFGKVTNEELKLKQCQFDREAPAVVLLDEAVANYNSEYNLLTDRHIRIKILHEKGMDYGNIAIPFWRIDNFEFISDIEAIVINQNADGSLSRHTLEKKSIFTKNVSDQLGEVRFTMPAIKAGSIIEYRYKSTMKNYNGLDDWHFQREIPVVQSKFRIYILPNYEFAYKVYKASNMELKVNSDPQGGNAIFEMENIPGLENEPYMDARRDYIQRVTFQLSGYGGGFNKRKYLTSWDDVIKTMMTSNNFGDQLNKVLPGTDDFIKTCKANPSAFNKMKVVYNYVRTNMSWNRYNSKYSSDGVKSAWNKKSGTSGDLNLILINLLKAAGLEAYPMLVSERYHGKVNTEYPFIDQFNTVYAVVFIDGKKYYLDATDKLNPPHVIPYNILNTTAFILNKKVGGLVNITDESMSFNESINIKISLADLENAKGEASMISKDYAKIRRLEKYNNDKDKYVEENFKKSASSLSIDSFNLFNDDLDSLPLQQNFRFNFPVSGTGEYRFIPLNLFSGFQQNPFVSDKRFSDINFSFKRVIVMTTVLDLPKGYKVDAVPKSIKVINADETVLFSRELFNDEQSGKIMSRIKMDFKKSFYTPEEYDDIKAFYKTMFDILNEQIVLKKI